MVAAACALSCALLCAFFFVVIDSFPSKVVDGFENGLALLFGRVAQDGREGAHKAGILRVVALDGRPQLRVSRARQLIDEGKLPARQVGRDYVIEPAALDGVRVYGKPGRPSKAATEKAAKKGRKKPEAKP